MRPLRQSGRSTQAIGVSIPCGYGGWNLLDPNSQMPPEDAILIDNFFPEPGRIRMRNGFTVQSTGLGTGPVESLHQWAGATLKLLGAANNAIYDCTLTGAATLLYSTAITSNRWQGVNFANRLLLFNGNDAPLSYDGTTVTVAGWTGPADPRLLITATIYRNRVYAVERDTQRVWYGGVGAITGAMTSFDVSQVTLRGGTIQFCHLWTRDTGSGSAEFFVIAMDTGEYLIYQGAYPGDVTTWGLVARFTVGAPLSRRSFVNFGTQFLVNTNDGLLVFSDLLDMGTATPSTEISRKIGRAFNDMVAQYGTPFGWEGFFYPRGNMLIINAPVIAGATQYQFVMNTITRGWCRFTGVNANTWCKFRYDPYFGGNDGKVYRFDNGYADNGANVVADLQTAFDYYGRRGMLKRFTMLRPIIETDGTQNPAIEIDTDFDSRVPTSVPTSSGGGSPWDISAWNISPWGGSPTVFRNWFGVYGLGVCGSVRLRAATKAARLVIQSFDLLYEPGSYI